MTRRAAAALLWLLLASAGGTVLFVSAGTRHREAFNTDARILHRVLSQRMEQQEAVLNTVDALDGQGVGPAALGAYLTALLRPYPQVVAVERCSARGCEVLGTPAEAPPRLPPAVGAAPAARWPEGGGPLYALSRGRVRVWVDARRLTEALGAPLNYTLLQPGAAQVIVTHVPAPTPGAAPVTLRVQKVLGTSLQAFPIQMARAVPWRAWPWGAAAAWALLTAALTALLFWLQDSRRQAQRALLDERAWAGGVVQAASEAIVALDGQGRVTLANPAARTTLAHGLTPGTDLRAVTTFRATLSQAPFDAATFWDSQAPTVLPAGLTLVRESGPVQVEGALTPLRGAQGELRGRVLILREAGALQRRMLGHLEEGERRVREHEEMLAHVSRLSTLGEMGAGLAHELNQPLTAIVSYSQAAARLLDDPEPDLSRVRYAVTASVTQAGRATQIIARLRQWVRRAPSRARATDLAQATQNVLTLCRADLSRQGVQVRTAFPDTPLVQADPVQLEQIILNLLRNALEALHRTPAPLITLNVEGVGATWTLTVLDNGPGIAPAVAPRLFTPFTTSKDGGLGLGLSLSQTLAQNMGGDLRGENVAGGALFTLSLPRLALEAASD